jgi:hypothetical protein
MEMKCLKVPLVQLQFSVLLRYWHFIIAESQLVERRRFPTTRLLVTLNHPLLKETLKNSVSISGVQKLNTWIFC